MYRPELETLERRDNPSPTPILPWAFTGGPTQTAGVVSLANGNVGVQVTKPDGSTATADTGIPNAASFQVIQIGGDTVQPDAERVPATNPMQLTWYTGDPHALTMTEVDLWFADAAGPEKLSSLDGGLTWSPYTPPVQQAQQQAAPVQAMQTVAMQQTATQQQATPQVQRAQVTLVVAVPVVDPLAAAGLALIQENRG